MPEEYKLIIHADKKNVSGHFYTELKHTDANGNITSNFFGLNQTLNDAVGWADFAYDDGVVETNAQLASRQFGSFTNISKSITLTAAQFNSALLFGNNSVLSPGTYAVIGHNCVDYTQQMYTAAGQPGHFAYYTFTEAELNSIGSAGGYANNEYGHSNWFATLGDDLLSLSNYVDATTHELKGSTKPFYTNLINSFVHSDQYHINNSNALTSIASSLGLTLSQLENIAGNTYLQDRHVTMPNGGFMYLWKTGDKLNYTPTDNDFDYVAPAVVAPWVNTIATTLDYAKTLHSPLVLDLNNNGVELKHLDNGVYFDIDNDGFAEKIGWVKGTDGMLAMDRNGNGMYDR